jgi:hypothetical protein
VYLVDDVDFVDFADDAPKFVRQVCDERLISWMENYNFC